MHFRTLADTVSWRPDLRCRPAVPRLQSTNPRQQSHRCRRACQQNRPG